MRRERFTVRPLAALMALVLLARQATDAARFLVLALSVATGMPVLAAVGGAIGTGATLTLAWALGAAWEERLPLAAIRLGIAGLFVVAAGWAALAARGAIG